MPTQDQIDTLANILTVVAADGLDGPRDTDVAIDAILCTLFPEYPSINTIYLVFKNADFTEGRGPMLFNKAFFNKEDATNYIKSQKGIMGTDQYDKPSTIFPGEEYWNGFELRTVEIN